MKLAQYLDSTGEPDFKAAQALGITPAHLSRLRAGVCGCSLPLAVKIERWSGGAVTPADLLPVQEGEAA
jgi:DNA-binding transcriptional regulator YdaS (Cro superfamily)